MKRKILSQTISDKVADPLKIPRTLLESSSKPLDEPKDSRLFS
jgi:hypothetical protein